MYAPDPGEDDSIDFEGFFLSVLLFWATTAALTIPILIAHSPDF